MGKAETKIRQCPLAMDKWIIHVIEPLQIILGLVIDTNKLTIAIPMDYVTEVRLLLDTTWHVNWKSFTPVNEAKMLTGKLGHLAKRAPWVHHLLMQMYEDIAKALSGNKDLLLEFLQDFCNIVQSLQTGSFVLPPKDQSCHISSALKRAAWLIHHSKPNTTSARTCIRKLTFSVTNCISIFLDI